MQIVKEVTEWAVDYRQPNHVYLMDGDKVYAYQKWGEGEVMIFDPPSKISKRYRKFKPVKTNCFDDILWMIIGEKNA